MVETTREPLRGYLAVKRPLDLIVTVLFAPVWLSVMALVALVVMIDVGRPVLFVQPRVGRLGDPFNLYKFRTMKHTSARSKPAFASQDAARISRTGAILRKYRLDELPQLFNVLKGDMSIIGPRPEQVGFAKTFSETIDRYDERHHVLPGITGLAQVNSGYADDVDSTKRKLKYDLEYVRHVSPWLDLKIAIRTIGTILVGFCAK